MGDSKTLCIPEAKGLKASSMISEQMSIGNLIICEDGRVTSSGDGRVTSSGDGRVTSSGDGRGNYKILPTSGMTSLPRWVMEV